MDFQDNRALLNRAFKSQFLNSGYALLGIVIAVLFIMVLRKV